MLPSDPQDDHGLYQPPRPPLPAPTPYTHPRPPHGLMVQAQQIPQTHNIYNPHPQDSPIYYTPRQQEPPPQPLQASRYPPFQPVQQYNPPPNPRVGAAGLPPSMSGPDNSFPIIRSSHTPRSPLGGPGSLSCPTSLSEQAGVTQQTQQSQQPPIWTPRTLGPPTLSHSSLVVPRAPPSMHITAAVASHPPAGLVNMGIGGGGHHMPPQLLASVLDHHPNAHPHPPHSNHQPHHSPPQLTDEQELKTRSLPTRCSHKPIRGPGGVHSGGGNHHGGGGSGQSHRVVLGGNNNNGGRGGVCEEDGFFYSQPLVEEGVEGADETGVHLYGSSEDLSSGSSILEKLMVWAYYSDPEEDTHDDDGDDEDDDNITGEQLACWHQTYECITNVTTMHFCMLLFIY